MHIALSREITSETVKYVYDIISRKKNKKQQLETTIREDAMHICIEHVFKT